MEIQWTDEKVSRLWGYYAGNPSCQNQYFSFHSGKNIIAYIKRYIRISKMQAVLDFGCGPGYLLGRLLKICSRGKCHGLDFSRESIALVNEQFKNNPAFKNAVCVSALPSSFAADSMDLVVSVEVVEHLDDCQLAEILKEIYRVLAPKGYIVVTTKNKEDLDESKTMCPECGAVFHRWQHVRVWDRAGLKQVMEKAGFQTIRIDETYFGHRLKKMLLIFNSVFKKDSFLPHLIYIGKKLQ